MAKKRMAYAIRKPGAKHVWLDGDDWVYWPDAVLYCSREEAESELDYWGFKLGVAAEIVEVPEPE